MRYLYRLSVGGMLLFWSLPGAAAVLRVNGAASGVGADGSTWLKAYPTLQGALAVAGAGDELWVAAGTHRPAAPGGSRAASFVIPNGVALYGGFAGIEATREARDPRLHVTILNGDITSDDATAGSPTTTNNTYRVVQVLNAGSDANRLDGFTISGGYASLFPYVTGAGLFVEGSHLTVAQCTFAGNFALNNGGGVFTKDSRVTLVDCTFTANSSYGFGAAMAVSPDDAQTRRATASIERCLFQSSDSYALSANNADVTVKRTYFTDNEGGALCATDRVALSAENCVATRNGGVSGVFYIGTRSTGNLVHCTLANDYATECYVEADSLLATTVTISSSILWNASETPIECDEDTAYNAWVTVSNSIVTGDYPGTGNLNVAPSFRLCEPSCQLNWDSPAIDAGPADATSLDIAGTTRPQNASPDLGAYEFGADTDGAGLPDTYETDHGLSASDPADDAIDSDSDGLTNREEFRRGTDPRNPADPPSEYYVSKTGSDSDGSGTVAAPWLTIGHAMLAIPEGAPTFSVTVHVGAGTFTEPVVLRPYTRLFGAGEAQTTIRYFNAAATERVVVTGAQGAALKDCTVTFPDAVTQTAELVRVSHVSMEIERVTLDGRNSPNSFGLFVRGAESSQSVIRYSTVRRTQYGVYATSSGINVTRNFFEDILDCGIYIRPPESKDAADQVTPMLGTTERIETTGFNRFRMATGYFINNSTSGVAFAQYNYWGDYDDPADIQSRVVTNPGSVSFEPFLGKSCVQGTVSVELRADATDTILGEDVDPEVTLGSYSMDRDPQSGLFILSNVQPGSYQASAAAKGYKDASKAVLAQAGLIVAVSIGMTKGTNDGPGGCFGGTATPDTGLAWDSIIYLLALVAVVYLPGWVAKGNSRRRRA